MKKVLIFALLTLFLGGSSFKPNKDTRCYELRVYYCEAGKLPDLLNRFRNHTTQLFEKHGMTNVGYWTPIHNEQNALYYVLSFPSREAREKAWAAFGADPEWQTVKAKSEENGKIIAKIESTILKTTDFSPKVKKSNKGNRVFELRTYTSPAGKSPNIQARFRNHTMKLFEKQGMKNMAYWTTVDNNGAEPKLVYLLAHKSEAEGKASFDRFVKDPEWIKVRDDSEKNGKIIEKIESVYLEATDFSKIR